MWFAPVFTCSVALALTCIYLYGRCDSHLCTCNVDVIYTCVTCSIDAMEMTSIFTCTIPVILCVVDDIGDHLCERVLSVLLEMWLLCCARCFPSPSLWKTFRVMCINWRHHEALVLQWHRVNHVLTCRLLRFMYGPDYPELQLCKYLVQGWLRQASTVSNKSGKRMTFQACLMQEKNPPLSVYTYTIYPFNCLNLREKQIVMVMNSIMQWSLEKQLDLQILFFHA